jgi:hypothetical protein
MSSGIGFKGLLRVVGILVVAIEFDLRHVHLLPKLPLK